MEDCQNLLDISYCTHWGNIHSWDTTQSGSSRHLFISSDVKESQEDPGLSGSSRHLRRIPDCQDPLNTCSYAHWGKGLSGGSRTVRIHQTPQEDPRLSGSSRHLRRIPDCQDPLNTCSYAHWGKGLSGGSRTVRILQTPQEDPRLSGSSRHLRRIPDCQDPPDTLGGSQTLRILWTLVHMPTEVRDSEEDPGLLNSRPVPIGNLRHVCSPEQRPTRFVVWLNWLWNDQSNLPPQHPGVL